MISDRELGDQVYIIGQVSPTELKAYYRACDLLVHPSVVDSFSIVCPEAMTMGKPFICTRNIGITEYITNGHEALVVPSDDIVTLTRKIDTLLSNEEIRNEMGRRAKNTADSPSLEIITKRISLIYEKCIEPQQESFDSYELGFIFGHRCLE